MEEENNQEIQDPLAEAKQIREEILQHKNEVSKMLSENKAIANRAILSGRSGISEAKKEEKMTPQEYAKRIMAGEKIDKELVQK